MTIFDKEFFGAGSGGERGVLEQNRRGNFAGIARIGNIYGPACGSGNSSDGVESASAGRDEGGGDALVAKKFRNAVDGEALADAAGVELHRLMVGEGDGA